MCYNHVISVHCLMCALVCVCAWACVCLCSFMFGLHCYWLDCSHPPIHPIATIATDGAAGINVPGSASLINGRLTKPLTSFCRDFESSYLLHPPAASYHGCSPYALPFLSVVLDHFYIHTVNACLL